MDFGPPTFVAAAVVASCSVFAQTAAYQPMGQWVDPQAQAFSQWEAERLARARPAPETRPLLPGLRPRSLELLQDGLLRKFTTKVKTADMARRHIIRLSTNRAGLNVLNGAMAEGLFADRNPEFSYVRSPNASQHDFTRRLIGGGRENVQVKFHESGDPARYLLDMRKDWRATRFAVPDDHVDALKAYVLRSRQAALAAGDLDEAARLARDFGRVRGIRASASEVISGISEGRNVCLTESHAVYVSLGASLVQAIGPELWDWAAGTTPTNQTLYRATRTLSLLGVGIGTDQLLLQVKNGSLRGTARGNVVVGTALAITQTTFLLYEYGWRKAFYQPQFYEEVGGTVGGIALGIAGSGAAFAFVPGPGWVVSGTAIVAGAAAGTVGYMGGRAGTQIVLEILAPKMLQERQKRQVADVQVQIESEISAAQKWP